MGSTRHSWRQLKPSSQQLPSASTKERARALQPDGAGDASTKILMFPLLGSLAAIDSCI